MQYSQYFHFEGTMEISPEVPRNGGAMRASIDEASCVIVPGGEVDARWKSWRDPYLHDTYTVPATKGLPSGWGVDAADSGEQRVFDVLLTDCREASPPVGYLGGKPGAFFDLAARRTVGEQAGSR